MYARVRNNVHSFSIPHERRSPKSTKKWQAKCLPLLRVHGAARAAFFFSLRSTVAAPGHYMLWCLFAILLNIGVLALDNDFDGLFAAEDVADDGLLALEALVDALTAYAFT